MIPKWYFSFRFSGWNLASYMPRPPHIPCFYHTQIFYEEYKLWSILWPNWELPPPPYGSAARWTLASFFFSILILYTVGRTPWTGDQPVTRPLPADRTAQTQNKRTQTSMPRVGFEPTIPVFERATTVDVLDRAATVIGEMGAGCEKLCTSS
jgi:hypothetical protein